MFVVYNPAAGRRRVALLWRVLDFLVGNGVRVELVETLHAGHATALARAAAAGGARLVVAAGGDGTIAEVAQGLLGSPCNLGVIPLGTANVLARELGLDFAPRAVAASLAFGRTRFLQPGLITHPGVAGQGAPRLFVQMAGAGFDAAVVHQVGGPLKRRLGKGAYVVRGMQGLATYGFPPLRVKLDGREISVASAIICKGRLYGGPYVLAAGADSAGPGFTVALFHRNGPGFAALAGAALPLGLLPSLPGVELVRARQIEVLGHDAKLQADGDAAGAAPVVISDAPGGLRVVVN